MRNKISTRRDVLRVGSIAACVASSSAIFLPRVAKGQALPAGSRRVVPSNDDRLSIQTAIDELELEGGGVVELVAGTYSLSSRLIIHNTVTLRGSNGRNTEIVPAYNFCNKPPPPKLPTGYCDDYLFEFRNPNPLGPEAPYRPQFNCRLENLSIKLRDNTAILAAIWAPSWNEQCGLRNVLIWQYANHAVLFTDGFGGSATLEIRECEFMAGIHATANYAGLLFHNSSAVGYTNVLLNHVVIAGTSPRVVDYVCLEARNGINVVASGIHVENCDHGIYLTGRSGLTVSGLTGSPTGVLNLITCGSNFSGRVFGSGVLRGGASGYVLRDNKNGKNIADERNPLVFP